MIETIYQLGVKYLQHDHPLGMPLLLLAAQSDYPLAQNQLALIYQHGWHGKGSDLNNATYWFQRAMERQHPDAYVGLAVLRMNASSHSNAEILPLLQEAATRGSVWGCFELGIKCLEGEDKDEPKAFQLLLRASEGDSNPPLKRAILYHLGRCYRQGLGVDIDLQLAYHHTLQAAELGHPRAIHDLATHFSSFLPS